MRRGQCSRAKQIRQSESCRVAREQTAGARRELESRLARFLKGGLCFCLFFTESNRLYLRTTLYLKRTAFGKRPFSSDGAAAGRARDLAPDGRARAEREEGAFDQSGGCERRAAQQAAQTQARVEA